MSALAARTREVRRPRAGLDRRGRGSRSARAPTIAVALTLASAMLPACLLGYAPGVAVEVSLAGASPSGVSADGARFEGIAGSLRFASIELAPCAETEARLHTTEANRARRAASHAVETRRHTIASSRARRAVSEAIETRWRELLAPSRALAHHTASDAIEPGAIDLGDREVVLGAVSPPPGRYCALEVRVTPAAEAEGSLSGGESLALHARATREDGAFEWAARGPGNLEIMLPLIDEAGQPAPIELGPSDRRARVELEIEWDAVLGSVALVERDPVDLALDVVVRLRTALRARTVRGDVDP